MSFAAAAADKGSSSEPGSRGIIRASGKLLKSANKIRAALNARRQAVAGGVSAPNRSRRNEGGETYITLATSIVGVGQAANNDRAYMRLLWSSGDPQGKPVSQSPYLIKRRVLEEFPSASGFTARGRDRLLFDVPQRELDTKIAKAKPQENDRKAEEWKYQLTLKFQRPDKNPDDTAVIESDMVDRVRKGMINYSSFDDLTEKQLLEHLKPQNVIDVKKLKEQKDKPTRYLLTFKGEVVPEFITAEYERIRVWELGPTPFQCGKCLRYGHTAKRCTSEKFRCRTCSAEMTFEELQTHKAAAKCKAHCFACAAQKEDGEDEDVDHSPARIKCPQYEFESLVALLRAERHLPPRKAEEEVMKLIEGHVSKTATEKAKRSSETIGKNQAMMNEELKEINRQRVEIDEQTQKMQKEIAKLDKAKQQKKMTIEKLNRLMQETSDQDAEIEKIYAETQAKKMTPVTDKKSQKKQKKEEKKKSKDLSSSHEDETTTTDADDDVISIKSYKEEKKEEGKKEENAAAEEEAKMDTSEEQQQLKKRTRDQVDSSENDAAAKDSKKSKVPKFCSLKNIHKNKDTAKDEKEIGKWVTLNRLFLEAQGSSPIADFSNINQMKSGILCDIEDGNPYSIIVKAKGKVNSPGQCFTALFGDSDGALKWLRDEDSKKGSSTD